MDEILQMFLAAQHEFGQQVHAVPDDGWRSPTPDPDWTVADLVEHLVVEHRWLPPLVHGLDLAAAGEVVQGTRSLPVDGGVGANLVTEWDEAARAAADAITADGALERTVELSRGATPVRAYLREMTLDAVVHGWDLAVATGSAPAPAPELVEFALRLTEGMDLAGSGVFGPAVAVPDDAPALDRLVARTGRRPDWSAPAGSRG